MASKEEGKQATIIYALYLAGLILGITALVGLIMAYMYKSDAPEWVQSHYRYQIRTFWIGLLYAVIGAVLSVIGVGLIILLGFIVWHIVRCVKGLKLTSEARPIENPKTWWI